MFLIIKSLIKNALLDLINLISQTELKLDAIKDLRPYFNKKGLQEYWKAYPNNDKKKKKVIIYGLRTYATHHQAVFEKVFSDLFRFHGANVKNLVCGDILPSCDGATKDVPDWLGCHVCRKQRKYHINNFPNDFIFFNQFISKKEIDEIKKEVQGLTDDELPSFEYFGVKVGRHAIDSVCYAFQFVFDYNNKSHLKKLRGSVYRGMITVQVAKNLLAVEKPTHMLTLHGCYASWGPFSEYLSKNGVSVYVHRILLTPGMGYFDFPKWTFDINSIPSKEIWEQKKHAPLCEEHKNRVKSFIMNRKSGTSPDYVIFYEQKKGKDDKFRKYLNSNKKKFVLYMHSLWDVGFEEATSDCFNSHLDWLTETIEYFIGKENAYLFIKPHPAEYSRWEQRRHGGEDVISQLFKNLPNNIIIMKNDLPYTSYDLMDNGCIGITYYGTVGLEHSFFKKPILVGGNIHYVEAGAAYKIKSKEEYFQLIDNPEPLVQFPVKNYDTIERYAYHYFFRPSIRTPFYRDDVWLGHCIDWNVLKNYNEFIENDKTMNHIANSILNNIDVANID